MITDRHNCDDGYISLVNINLKNLPNTIEVGDYKLLRKSEFHISLVCLKQLDMILDPDILSLKKDELIEAFLDFERSHTLTEFKLTGGYRLTKRGDRVTIVAMVDVPNINDLFDTLRNSTGVDIPTQPTHITIYTLQPEAGIGLTSRKQVEHDSEIIELPTLSDVQIG